MVKIATSILLAVLCWGLTGSGSLETFQHVSIAATRQTKNFDNGTTNDSKKSLERRGQDVSSDREEGAKTSINESDINNSSKSSSDTASATDNNEPSSNGEEDPVAPPTPNVPVPAPVPDNTFQVISIAGTVVNLLFLVFVVVYGKIHLNKLVNQEAEDLWKKIEQRIDNSTNEKLENIWGRINELQNTLDEKLPETICPDNKKGQNLKRSEVTNGTEERGSAYGGLKSEKSNVLSYGNGSIAFGTSQNTTMSKTDFVANFNDMLRYIAERSLYDSSVKEKKQQFASTYNVKPYMCENHNARISNPNELPRFVECTASKATIWCIPAGENWIIFPAPRDYEENVHTHGGLGLLFTSNYRVGSCRIIKVNRPAITSKDFRNIRKGDLKLSEE